MENNISEIEAKMIASKVARKHKLMLKAKGQNGKLAVLAEVIIVFLMYMIGSRYMPELINNWPFWIYILYAIITSQLAFISARIDALIELLDDKGH